VRREQAQHDARKKREEEEEERVEM
jgi:hypothetical protein